MQKSLKYLFILLYILSPLIAMHTPQNTVIGFDLHDTYLQKTPWRYTKDLFSIFSHSDNKWDLFCLMPQGFKLYNRVKVLSKTYDVNQYVIENLCKEFPALLNIEDKLHRANAVSLYKPIPEMVELVKELKQAGYTIFVVSNIGLKQYQFTVEKYSQEFEPFDDYFIPSKAPSKAAKPNVQFYTDLRDWLDAKGLADKTLLFIDDRQDYINGAQKAHALGANIDTLLFVNPQQLRCDFENRRTS